MAKRTSSKRAPTKAPGCKLPLQEDQIRPLSPFTRNLGFAIIGLAVVGAFFLTPLPVAIGLTILAVLRLWIWQRQVKAA
ncbi:MAG TPA: hypothetical protein VFA07_18585 [Chthonomonadaceae bacterium]|nr:hypothetical protein [Chthonomonadaceae bacterium]